MARSRERESRPPPPPRITGMSLTTAALIVTVAAALFALLSVLFAAGGSDSVGTEAADSIGSGLVAVLTAPEPEWWSNDHGSWLQAWKEVRREMGESVPQPESEKLKRFQTEAWKQTERNKARLSGLTRSLGTFESGALRGLMIYSTGRELANHSVGARIRPDLFRTEYTLPGNISVGRMQATGATGAGVFEARVYHRPYVNRSNERVGYAFVILSEAALQPKGGAGAWLLLAPLLVALACAGFLFFANRTADGIKGVVRDLETIGRGKLEHRVHVGGSGEVGYLQRAVDRMAKNLQLIQTTGSGDLDEALAKELDLATQIHQGLLPADTPRLPGYELETIFKIGRDIGGDYHDYVELDDNRFAFVIADCSENLRGVPAAMVMAMTRAYLKAAIDPETGPGDWLKTVNRRLARDLKPGMAVTAVVVVLDTAAHEAFAASAGHRPLVMWRQGKTATINPNGIALGLDIGPVFDKTLEEKKFTMQKNDRLVIYTDGLTTAQNEAGEAYGEQRLLEAVRRQGAMNSAAFVNFIAGGVDKFLGEAEQTDDITICTLKRMK